MTQDKQNQYSPEPPAFIDLSILRDERTAAMLAYYGGRDISLARIRKIKNTTAKIAHAYGCNAEMEPEKPCSCGSNRIA